ncbi:unnamed protein product [Rodentolepis nana]|uniref:Uncharacterized protein n=1 Tax=Rodentolepis nana TaxID=102285 RepID=A0A0R3TP52_RODNA|nr:unnamed protein product [Rodentolepis nana]
MNAYMQPSPAPTTLIKASAGVCSDSISPPSPSSWHLITAYPTNVVAASVAGTPHRSTPLANNAVAALPDTQTVRKSFTSRVSEMLFPQKMVKGMFIYTICHGDGCKFIASPPPSSMLLLTPSPASPITVKSKSLSDHRQHHHHDIQELEPQPAYSDGSNTYYVINIDRRWAASSTAYPATPKTNPLSPHPPMVIPGPDTSYV